MNNIAIVKTADAFAQEFFESSKKGKTLTVLFNNVLSTFNFVEMMDGVKAIFATSPRVCSNEDMENIERIVFESLGKEQPYLCGYFFDSSNDNSKRHFLGEYYNLSYNFPFVKFQEEAEKDEILAKRFFSNSIRSVKDSLFRKVANAAFEAKEEMYGKEYSIENEEFLKKIDANRRKILRSIVFDENVDYLSSQELFFYKELMDDLEYETIKYIATLENYDKIKVIIIEFLGRLVFEYHNPKAGSRSILDICYEEQKILSEGKKYYADKLTSDYKAWKDIVEAIKNYESGNGEYSVARMNVSFEDDGGKKIRRSIYRFDIMNAQTPFFPYKELRKRFGYTEKISHECFFGNIKKVTVNGEILYSA